jgi:hypothetical protein
MQLKVKVQVKSQQIPLENLINGLERIDYARLQERAMDIIEDQARLSVFIDTPTPSQMMSAFQALHGHIERASKESIPVRTDPVYEYGGDNELKQEMANSIQRIKGEVILGRQTVKFHRNYELQEDKTNPDTMFINLSNPKIMWHDYVELHLDGFYGIDLDNADISVIPANPPIVLKSGPAIYTKGRDVMLYALFSSIPNILNMMKRVILRNMGIYI